MSGHICYFIGGPLDLTKSYIRHPEREMYALDFPALTHWQTGRYADKDNVVELADKLHVYHRVPNLTVHGVKEAISIYMYSGLRDRRSV